MATTQSRGDAVGYTGHGANTGGLQGHSIGVNYPYTVIGVGSHWAAMDLRTGRTGNKQRSYKEAELDITSLKLRNLMHS